HDDRGGRPAPRGPRVREQSPQVTSARSSSADAPSCAGVLNWLVRYAPVAADVEIARASVLDVGSGPVGVSLVFPGARFAGPDVEFPTPVPREMFAVRTDPARFPWADGAFDTVVCLDVLEHVAAAQRSWFVGECARVTARRVLLACPTDTAVNADEFFA